MNHQGTRRLETPRLILRRFSVQDAPSMYTNWASDPAVTEFLTWPAHASEDVSRMVLKDWTAQYADPSFYTWGLEIRETGELIGSLSVVRLDEDIGEAELGWCIGRRWWGMGYTPEAAAAVRDYLFDAVGVNRLSAKHDVNNPKSGRVMAKIGMRIEGVRRQGGRNNKGVVDMACRAMLKSDMEAQNPSFKLRATGLDGAAE